MSDYRPDLYGRVEASYRTAPPPQELVDRASTIECSDCNVNVFLEETATDGEYTLTIAHDSTCPWLAAHEGQVDG